MLNLTGMHQIKGADVLQTTYDNNSSYNLNSVFPI